MEELHAAATAGRSRVTKVAVTGLFGLYDHIIDLNEADRITIVHGPNGVGKTVLLKAIAAFFAGNYSLLSSTPFSSLTIWINNQEHVVISRSPSGKKGSQPHFAIDVALQLDGAAQISTVYRIELPDEYIRFASSMTRHIPGLQQIGPEEFFDSRLSMPLDAEQVIWRYADHPAIPAAYKRRISSVEPVEVRKFRQRVNIQMIETNRLYKVASNEFEFATSAQLKDRITDYATQLSDRIEQTLADYGRNAQKFDQTFPHRLISEEILPLSVDALKRSIKDLDDTQKALSEFGLLERVMNFERVWLHFQASGS